MNSSAADNKTGSGCEFQENLEILRQIGFFAGLPIETLKIFAYLCSRETFQSGDYLFARNDDDGQAFYLISGRALLAHAADDTESEVLAFGPGDFLGGLALLGSMPRLYSLKAVDTVACLVLTREKFIKAIEQFPELTPRLLKTVVVSIRSWEQHHLMKLKSRGLSLKGMAGISAL
ncbi:MAG: cyclic nucleotide-binding domain-containing protein [Desulfosarcina sp.]|nr:cyclic nucleotide-binding domain-containing protein [Desulfobacterales bacterium]